MVWTWCAAKKQHNTCGIPDKRKTIRKLSIGVGLFLVVGSSKQDSKKQNMTVKIDYFDTSIRKFIAKNMKNVSKWKNEFPKFS